MKFFLYISIFLTYLVVIGNYQLSASFPQQQSELLMEGRRDDDSLENFRKEGVGKPLNTHNVPAKDIIATASEFLGVPHCMGGSTSNCMDCSGLLVAVFSKYGIHLPHSAEEQARYGKIITLRDSLQKGDLVFFSGSYNADRFISHTGIYTGGGKFIHTSVISGVTITSLDNPWWKEKFVFGTRVLE